MLAKREHIKMSVDEMTGKVYQKFSAELSNVKKEFDMCKNDPPIHRSFPREWPPPCDVVRREGEALPL